MTTMMLVSSEQWWPEERQTTTRISLISRTFPPLTSDCLNYGNTNTEGRGLGDLVTWWC